MGGGEKERKEKKSQRQVKKRRGKGLKMHAPQ